MSLDITGIKIWTVKAGSLVRESWVLNAVFGTGMRCGAEIRVRWKSPPAMGEAEIRSRANQEKTYHWEVVSKVYVIM